MKNKNKNGWKEVKSQQIPSAIQIRTIYKLAFRRSAHFALMKSYFKANVSKKVQIIQNEMSYTTIIESVCKFCAHEIISCQFDISKQYWMCVRWFIWSVKCMLYCALLCNMVTVNWMRISVYFLSLCALSEYGWHTWQSNFTLFAFKGGKMMKLQWLNATLFYCFTYQCLRI